MQIISATVRRKPILFTILILTKAFFSSLLQLSFSFLLLISIPNE